MCPVDRENPGRYRIIERIAEGGMAVVDRALSIGPDGFQRELVLKRIRPRFSRDPRFAAMFVDEARIVSQLNHPNIVQIYEFGRIDGDYFLAMEHVPGVDLARLGGRLMERGERFPIPLALFITIEVCRALDYAHRKRGPDGASLGIIHRDVSPANVLVSHEGAVKLADFGIARAAERKEQTLDGVVKGKVAYMSPEQLRDEPLDGRTDLFSAAVILYLLLAGEHPFAGLNDGETIRGILASNWPPPSQHAPDIPPTLDRIVLKALSRDRFERHETAAALAEELEEFLFESHLRASASEVTSLMKRLYGDDAAGAPLPKVSLDDVMASELRQLAGPVDELPHYTALVEAHVDRGAPASKSKTATEPMFRIPESMSESTPEAPSELPFGSSPTTDFPGDEGVGPERSPTQMTQPAMPGRWENHESQVSVEAPRETRTRSHRVLWPIVLFGCLVLIGLVFGAFMATHSPLGSPASVLTDASGAAEVSPTADTALVLAETGPRPPDAAAQPPASDLQPRDAGPGAPDAAPQPPDAPPPPPASDLQPPSPPTPPRALGWLRVATRPHYAEVFIDGRRRGTTPLLIQVPRGRHRVRLVNAQLGRSERRSVNVGAQHHRSSPASIMVEGF